jgi:hypothetical protein
MRRKAVTPEQRMRDNARKGAQDAAQRKAEAERLANLPPRQNASPTRPRIPSDSATTRRIEEIGKTSKKARRKAARHAHRPPPPTHLPVWEHGPRFPGAGSGRHGGAGSLWDEVSTRDTRARPPSKSKDRTQALADHVYARKAAQTGRPSSMPKSRHEAYIAGLPPRPRGIERASLRARMPISTATANKIRKNSLKGATVGAAATYAIGGYMQKTRGTDKTSGYPRGVYKF